MAKKKPTPEKLTPIPRPGRVAARKAVATPERPEPSAAEPDLTHIAAGLRPLAVPVAQLHFDPANARKHDEDSVSGIAASLRVYGQVKPVVCRQDTGVVIAGNGTLQAALSLGWTHLAAVRVAFDPATAAGFAVADNRTAELSEWDRQALDRLLREVSTDNDPRLDQMLAELAKEEGLYPAADPEGGESPETGQTWKVVTDCADERDQEALVKRLRAEGYTCHAKRA